MFLRFVLAFLVMAAPLAAQTPFRLTTAQIALFDAAHQAIAVATPASARTPLSSLDQSLASSLDPAAAVVREQVAAILHLIDTGNANEALLFTHRLGSSVGLRPPVANDAAARTQLTAIKTELATAAPGQLKVELLAQELACHIDAGSASYRANMLAGLNNVFILVALGKIAAATAETDKLLALLPAPPSGQAARSLVD